MCQKVQSDSPLRRARARHSTKSVQARFADKYGLDRCRSTAIHPRGWHEAKCRALLQRCRILNADRGVAHSSIRRTGQAAPIAMRHSRQMPRFFKTAVDALTISQVRLPARAAARRASICDTSAQASRSEVHPYVLGPARWAIIAPVASRQFDQDRLARHHLGTIQSQVRGRCIRSWSGQPA